MYVHIRAYTCIYDLGNRTGSLHFCTYMRTYLHVYASMCKYTYINAPKNFPYKKYVHIRAIRANTCKYGTVTAQDTYIIRAYTYFIFAKIRAHTADRMCTYCKYVQVYACILHVYVYVCKMYVYASMGKYVHVCKKFLNHTVYARICMYI